VPAQFIDDMIDPFLQAGQVMIGCFFPTQGSGNEHCRLKDILQARRCEGDQRRLFFKAGNCCSGANCIDLADIADVLCEDDVRRAIQSGKKLIVSERAIVTPAARDLGEQHRVFTFSPWRG